MTIVYVTVNSVNNKIYIGVHDCKSDVYDYYLGEGCYANAPCTYMKKKVPFAYALQKYGPKVFHRYTIAKFEDRQDALDLERTIVNEDFVKRPDTYNAIVGGGDPPRSDVIFYKYDLNGNYVEECINMHKTCKDLGISHDRILNAIKQKKSCENYYWSYEKVDKLDTTGYSVVNRGYVFQYSNTGEFIAEFKTVAEAAQKLDLSKNLIMNSLHRKSCPSGYYFIRGDEKIEDVMKGKSVDPCNFYKYDSNGNLVERYSDISEALSTLSKATRSGLKRAIFGERLYKDYYWSLELYSNFFKKVESKKVAQFDQDGNLIKTWNSVSECREKYRNLHKVLSGKYTNTKGFIFKYVD